MWRRSGLAAISFGLAACGLLPETVEQGSTLDLFVANRTDRPILVSDMRIDVGTAFEVPPCAVIWEQTEWVRGQRLHVDGAEVLVINEVGSQISGITIVVDADGSTTALLVDEVPGEADLRDPCG
jgi:hypothetical protein